MKVGFIGLGNVGGKLAGSLLRNNFDLTVRDLDKNLTQSFKDLGAKVVNSAKELAEQVDLIITCLPSPKICAEVMEAEDGVINGLSENKIWLEMSTTDEAEIKRISKKIIEKKLNKVVLSSNQVLIWDTLQSIGKKNSIEGFGKLFKS